jgi:hypothetical protein
MQLKTKRYGIILIYVNNEYTVREWRGQERTGEDRRGQERTGEDSR